MFIRITSFIDFHGLNVIKNSHPPEIGWQPPPRFYRTAAKLFLGYVLAFVKISSKSMQGRKHSDPKCFISWPTWSKLSGNLSYNVHTHIVFVRFQMEQRKRMPLKWALINYIYKYNWIAYLMGVTRAESSTTTNILLNQLDCIFLQKASIYFSIKAADMRGAKGTHSLGPGR